MTNRFSHILTMSVDVFGRQLIRAKEVHRGPAGVGFLLTEGGDFDIENRRLSNVGTAVDQNDAVNLNTLNMAVSQLKEEYVKLHDSFVLLEKKVGDLKSTDKNLSLENS